MVSLSGVNGPMFLDFWEKRCFFRFAGLGFDLSGLIRRGETGAESDRNDVAVRAGER